MQNKVSQYLLYLFLQELNAPEYTYDWWVEQILRTQYQIQIQNKQKKAQAYWISKEVEQKRLHILK
jgi:hypothetical protein